MKSARVAGSIVLSLVALACGEGGTPEAEAPPAASEGAAAGGMENMPGMGNDASAGMDAHLQAMNGAPPDSLAAMLPQHRQIVANMLSQMDREMRDMNMTSDAAWTALADSIRSDLTTMPELSATDLGSMMPGHEARVRRLMEMHQGMMGGMGM